MAELTRGRRGRRLQLKEAAQLQVGPGAVVEPETVVGCLAGDLTRAMLVVLRMVLPVFVANFFIMSTPCCSH